MIVINKTNNISLVDKQSQSELTPDLLTLRKELKTVVSKFIVDLNLLGDN
jgi:hypothetical protein